MFGRATITLGIGPHSSFILFLSSFLFPRSSSAVELCPVLFVLSVTLVYCGQTIGCIKMPLCTEVGLGPGDIVLDGDLAPPQKKGTGALPHFATHVYCGQPVGWIKMPLGRQVDLGLVRRRPSPPPRKDGQPPSTFGPCLLWANVRSSQQLLGSCSSFLPKIRC